MESLDQNQGIRARSGSWRISGEHHGERAAQLRQAASPDPSSFSGNRPQGAEMLDFLTFMGIEFGIASGIENGVCVNA
jgi:hypothetical protein